MKRLFCFILSALQVVCLLSAAVFAAPVSENPYRSATRNGEEDVSLFYLDEAGVRVDRQMVNGAVYLLLPANADFGDLPLYGGAVLHGTCEDTYAIADGSVDLQSVFSEELSSGKAYRVEVYTNDGTAVSDVSVMRADSIPTVSIVSNRTISEINSGKEIIGKGTVTMLSPTGELIVAPSDGENNLSKFKGRGNTGWELSGEKKPYAITLDSKAELIKGAGKAKKWNLISDNCQASIVHEAAGLANIAAYDLYQSIAGAYAVSFEPVNLYINGEYRGVYLLTEKVEIDKQRINISAFENKEDEVNTTVVVNADGLAVQPISWDKVPLENAVAATNGEDIAIDSGIQAYRYATASSCDSADGGFLLELDGSFYKECSWFVTRRGYAFVLKDPEFATREQVQEIAIQYQAFEDALFSDTGYNADGEFYSDFIETDSFIRKIAVDMVSGQCDQFINSCFISTEYINGEFSKFISGPAWDYDGSNYSTTFSEGISNPGYENYPINDKLLANTQYMIIAFLKHGEFTDALYQLVNGELATQLDEFTDSRLPGYMARMTASQNMNSIVWDYDGENPLPAAFDAFYDKFAARCSSWLDVWNNSIYLRGASVQKAGMTLTVAAVSGTTGLSYQWYRVSESDPTSAVAVSGASKISFKPEETGRYFCQITGKSMPGLRLTKMKTESIAVCQEHTPADTACIENRIEPTCVAAGSYDEVLYCTYCGEEISREQRTLLPTGEHTIAAQSMADGTHNVICSVCGAVFSNEYCTNANDDSVCDVCDAEIIPITDEKLVFAKTALSLESYIGVQFAVSTSVAEQYDTVYLSVNCNDTELEWIDSFDDGRIVLQQSDNGYYFTELRVAPKEMNISFDVSLYGVKDNVLYLGETICNTSVREKAVTAMDTAYQNVQSGTDVEENTARLTLLADLLLYGAAAQRKLDYQTQQLVTDGVSSDYLAYASTPAFEPVSTAYSVENVSRKGVVIYRTALSVSSAVQIQPVLKKLSKVSMEPLEVILHINQEDVVIPYSEFTVMSANYFHFVFDKLAAKEMNLPISLTVRDSSTETIISPTYTFSIASVACEKLGDDEVMNDLIYRMLAFGASAEHYLSLIAQNG